MNELKSLAARPQWSSYIVRVDQAGSKEYLAELEAQGVISHPRKFGHRANGEFPWSKRYGESVWRGEVILEVLDVEAHPEICRELIEKHSAVRVSSI